MLISAPRVDPGEKKEVTIALQFADVVSLDPIKTTHGPDYYVIPHIYSCLLSVDPFRPAVLLPDLARDWTISPDGKSITFRLREGVQWHKGYGEVTAEDARFTYERLKDADSGSIFVDLYKVI